MSSTMNLWTESKFLDGIIKLASELKSPTTEKISKTLQLEHRDVACFCEELRDKGYLALLPISTKGGYRGQEYIVTVTNKGLNFLLTEGGFKRQFFNRALDQSWKLVKIFAAVANSIAILVLSYLSYDFQKQKDERELKLKEQELTIKRQDADAARLKDSTERILLNKQRQMDSIQNVHKELLKKLKKSTDDLQKSPFA
ncbi:hypothetical protein LZD49_17265 [Dyadobacter sp. CY261]|uniref:hypothetical protein n=1 Tax=Dyadobacter sp. CY261 TaxID=2907203 RepID=UPI001F389083|nr:hypothetical protein [Dyadobacter sp. CY261]MCF0072233.1 hypothetical protein [Dyadobacter sp. CY261]